MPTRTAFLRWSGAAAAVGLVAGARRFPARADSAALTALRAKMSGSILLPGAPNYDSARRTFSFNPRTSAYPDVIALCKTEDDVRRALDFAQSRDMAIAVRGGGHDVLGASTVNGGIIIDLGGLSAIEPQPGSGVVRAGAGVRSGDLNDALQKTGHAVALGCNDDVGIAGLTLGGGLGWLLGTSGAACDNLVSARLLMVDGRVTDVRAETEPDLFWAIRGGGGNFGIATSLTYRIRSLGNIVGGWLAYRGERLVDFLHLFREFMSSVPPELTVEVMTTTTSRPLIFVTVAYVGDEGKAERVLAPLITFGPIATDVGTKPYADFSNPGRSIASLFKRPAAGGSNKVSTPGIYWMGASIATLSDEAISTVNSRLKDAPQNWAFNLGHYMHGAVSDDRSNDTPLLRRRHSMTYHFDSWWSDEKNAARAMEWVDTSIAAMKPYSARSTYINYLGSDKLADIEASYGTNYERLAAIKKRYDPHDVLRRNRNILPKD